MLVAPKLAWGPPPLQEAPPARLLLSLGASGAVAWLLGRTGERERQPGAAFTAAMWSIPFGLLVHLTPLRTALGLAHICDLAPILQLAPRLLLATLAAPAWLLGSRPAAPGPSSAATPGAPSIPRVVAVWTLLTTLGLLVAANVALAGAALLPGTGYPDCRPRDLLDATAMTAIALYIGLTVGALQWWALRDAVVPRAIRWIPATGIGLATGALATRLLFDPGSPTPLVAGSLFAPVALFQWLAVRPLFRASFVWVPWMLSSANACLLVVLNLGSLRDQGHLAAAAALLGALTSIPVAMALRQAPAPGGL